MAHEEITNLTTRSILGCMEDHRSRAIPARYDRLAITTDCDWGSTTTNSEDEEMRTLTLVVTYQFFEFGRKDAEFCRVAGGVIPAKANQQIRAWPGIQSRLHR